MSRDMSTVPGVVRQDSALDARVSRTGTPHQKTRRSKEEDSVITYQVRKIEQSRARQYIAQFSGLPVYTHCIQDVMVTSFMTFRQDTQVKTSQNFRKTTTTTLIRVLLKCLCQPDKQERFEGLALFHSQTRNQRAQHDYRLPRARLNLVS